MITFEFHTTIGRSSFPLFSDCLSYAIWKLQMTSISLKTEQRYSMMSVYDRHNVFVWLPIATGHGSSLCYQDLPFIMGFKVGLVGSHKHRLVLVISPLVALMVDKWPVWESEVHSVVTSSDGIDKDLLTTNHSLSTGSLLFFTPETLVQSKWKSSIDHAQVSQRIVALVADKAHWMSRW